MNLSHIMHIMGSCFAPNSLIFWKSCCEEEENVAMLTSKRKKMTSKKLYCKFTLVELT